LFPVAAFAEEDTTYSADSLMAAFKDRREASIKGSQIKFTGVIAEIKKSSVVFKSSGNDKVVCELSSSGSNWTGGHPVGSPLTVVGKVRGRGLLGNVTLDQCGLASTETSIQPVGAELSQVLAEAVARPAEEETEPVTVADNISFPSAAPVTVADNISTRSATPPAPARKPLSTAAPITESVSRDAVIAPDHAITTPEPAAEKVPKDSTSHQTYSRGYSRGIFRAFVAVLLGIGTVLAFLKLRPIILTGFRPPTFATTDAARRAALEALLTKQKKRE